jgi:hypothetical protein
MCSERRQNADRDSAEELVQEVRKKQFFFHALESKNLGSDQ